MEDFSQERHWQQRKRNLEPENVNRQWLRLLSHTPSMYSAIYHISCLQPIIGHHICTIVSLWARPVSLENELCVHCNIIYQEQLVHAVCECYSYCYLDCSRFYEHISNILLPDEKHSLLELNSVALTLRLLGAPLEPTLNIDSEVLLLKNSFSYLVSSIQVYTNWKWTPISELNYPVIIGHCSHVVQHKCVLQNSFLHFIEEVQLTCVMHSS